MRFYRRCTAFLASSSPRLAVVRKEVTVRDDLRHRIPIAPGSSLPSVVGGGGHGPRRDFGEDRPCSSPFHATRGSGTRRDGLCFLPDPSGKNIGWLVVDESVIELRQHPTDFVVEAAVAGAGGVAGEGAAAHRRRPTKVVDAAAAVGGVAGEGAVAHRQLSEEVVLDATA